MTHAQSGIEKYLEHGFKKGRSLHRDELDKRVHLNGDLEAFSVVVKLSISMCDWKQYYDHISIGFSLEDNDKINDEVMRQINDEILDYYYPHIDKEKLVYHAEAHLPKRQTIVDMETGERLQRLGHIHIAVSRLDMKKGTQIQTKFRHTVSDAAFQTYLCQKYNLDIPLDSARQAHDQISKERILARRKGDYAERNLSQKPTQKCSQSERNKEIETLHGKLRDHLLDATSFEDVQAKLNAFPGIDSVTYKQQKSGNKYFQVKHSDSNRNINVQGRDFRNVERFYYSDSELAERVANGKFELKEEALLKERLEQKKIGEQLTHEKLTYFAKSVRQSMQRTKEQNGKIAEDAKEAWREKIRKQELAKQQKATINKKFEKFKDNVPLHNPEFDYEKIRKQYESVYEKYTKAQRKYFVMYKDNISEHLIDGFNIYDNQINKFLVNNEKGIKIYDSPNNITLELPQTREDRLDAIRLSLKIAEDKGWDLNNLKLEGSEQFKKEVQLCVNQINSEYKPDYKITFSESNAKVSQKTSQKLKSHLNSAHSALADLKDKHNAVQSEALLNDLKYKLYAQKVIDIAVTRFGVMKSEYEVSGDNKILDKRMPNRAPKSIIDFMTKTCNLAFSDAKQVLQDLYEEQKQKTKKLSKRLDSTDFSELESKASKTINKADTEGFEQDDSYSEHDYEADKKWNYTNGLEESELTQEEMEIDTQNEMNYLRFIFSPFEF